MGDVLDLVRSRNMCFFKQNGSIHLPFVHYPIVRHVIDVADYIFEGQDIMV